MHECLIRTSDGLVCRINEPLLYLLLGVCLELLYVRVTPRPTVRKDLVGPLSETLANLGLLY